MLLYCIVLTGISGRFVRATNVAGLPTVLQKYKQIHDIKWEPGQPNMGTRPIFPE